MSKREKLERELHELDQEWNRWIEFIESGGDPSEKERIRIIEVGDRRAVLRELLGQP